MVNHIAVTFISNSCIGDKKNSFIFRYNTNEYAFRNSVEIVYAIFITNIVPAPNIIIVTAPSTQIVGQSLTLECSVTTVRGITSRVDIVWSSDGVELNRTENVNITSRTDNMIEYMNVYTITLLKDTDINRTYQCEMVINSNPPVRVNNNVALNVTGKYFSLNLVLQLMCFYV